MIDLRLYKVTNGRIDYMMLREALKHEDEAAKWAQKTGCNRMCYDCKNTCKTKNQVWTGCVKREAKISL